MVLGYSIENGTNGKPGARFVVFQRHPASPAMASKSDRNDLAFKEFTEKKQEAIFYALGKHHRHDAFRHEARISVNDVLKPIIRGSGELPSKPARSLIT